MENREKLLIVDSHPEGRDALRAILEETYGLLLAETGVEAVQHMKKSGTEICAVLIAQDMEGMDANGLLRGLDAADRGLSFPVLVTAPAYDREREAQALSNGAWDYLPRPYDARIVLSRLKNAVERSRVFAFRQMAYLAEHDALTGIFNKTKFIRATQRMLAASPEQEFDLLRMDIDRFSLVNAFFGTAEGDRLLRFVAEELCKFARGYSQSTYGRLEADMFAVCLPRQTERQLDRLVERWGKKLREFRSDFDLQLTIGVYRVEDRELPVEKMLDCSNLAVKQVKKSYVKKCAYYSKEMSRKLEAEQEIVNEMSAALAREEFSVYIQPKYDLTTRMPVGGEALVRWDHPTRGLIQPGAFLPIFERNGFISKLDYYMWDKVCRLLHEWIGQGRDPAPISVNISPVDLYNANLMELLCGLTERYQIPNRLLQLELTESAYMNIPGMMQQLVRRLRAAGFTVLMDDFGHGLSSLNTLKDIDIDVLKIDMGFFTKTDIQGRGENILASVVRMAKWLNIATIAEGVERREQAEFLQSIGCEFVQGFYFARPMPVPAYEALMSRREAFVPEKKRAFDADALWATNPQMEILFSKMTQAMGIFELEGNHVEMLRVNQAHLDAFGFEGIEQQKNALSVVREEDRADVLEMFQTVAREEGRRECEYVRLCHGGGRKRIYLTLRFIDRIESKSVILCTLQDVTQQRAMDEELRKYRRAISTSGEPFNKMLVVDDLAVNRAVLRGIFRDSYEILQASNGKEAIRVLGENDNKVDVILLDLMMPEMDGREFLEYKKTRPELSDIPVVVITADNSHNQQVNILALGADDYIVKPFVKEVALRRVRNVLESHRRFREVLREYNTVLERAKTDPLTHLQNRSSGIESISEILWADAKSRHALIMLDVDHFKAINDSFGHEYGDQVLASVADRLRRFFRESDVVARFGGDEFCIFMRGIISEEAVVHKCMRLCDEVTRLGFRAEVSVSLGIAVSSAGAEDFETLYKNADAAMYQSKRSGRNTATMFRTGKPGRA